MLGKRGNVIHSRTGEIPLAIVSFHERENEEVLALQQQVQMLKDLLHAAKSPQKLQSTLDQEIQDKKNASDELSALYSQFDILKKRYAEVYSKAQQYENELKEKTNKAIALKEQLELAQQALNDKEASLLKVQDEFGGFKKRVDEIFSTNQQLQQDTEKALEAKEEAENCLKTAHYHLAKKVRENAELNDKLEIQEAKIRELSSALENARDENNQLQLLLDQKNEKEIHLQVLSQEAIHAAETLATSWEEKYHQLYEKVQTYEMRLADQVKLEEKFSKMQSLWKSLGAYLDNDKTPETTQKKPYQNLFV